MSAFTIHRLIDHLGIIADALVIHFLLSHFFYPRQKKELISMFFPTLEIVLLSSFIYSMGFGESFLLFTLSIFFATFIDSLLLYRGSFCMKLSISLLFTSLYFLGDGIALRLATSLQDALPGITIPVLAEFAYQRLLSKPLYLLILWPFMKDKQLSEVEMPTSYKVCLYIYCGFDCMILLVNIFILAHTTAKSPVIALLSFGFLAIIVVFFLMFLMLLEGYRKNLSYQLRGKEMQLHEEYLAQASEDMKRLREFRHDMKAHLFCMQGLLEQEKHEELAEYLSQFSEHPFLKKAIPSYCSDDIVNTLLVQKKRKAESEGIPFYFNIQLSNQLMVRRIDLCTVLSNLCDNALEAATKAENPYASLELREVKGYILIRMKNATLGNIKQQTPSLTTTKEDHLSHGHGLKIVQSIAKAYHGSVDLDSKEGSFTSLVLLENTAPPKES